MRWPKLFKNIRRAMFSYNAHEQYNHFKMKMLCLFAILVSVVISSFIPWFEIDNRYMLLYFFLVAPLVGLYYIRSGREDKRRIKKLKRIYNQYVISLTLEEESAIKNFLLQDCNSREFQSDIETLNSLELKQIIYKSSCKKIELYKIEPWAFDYFHVYKQHFN